MSDLKFRVIVETDGAKEKLRLIRHDADQARGSIEQPSNLYVLTEDANGKLRLVRADAAKTTEAIEKPATVKVDASAALASIRDLTIAAAGVVQAVSGITDGINDFLDAELTRRRSLTLAKQAFGETANEMSRFAAELQELTNFNDDRLLGLMAKMGAAFGLTNEEIKALTPALLDFTEAFSSTGLTVENAFNLMGRALNGHTEMLGRHGVLLDKNRLEIEGVSYLVEELTKKYGGTAEALADLRLQNRNTWKDVKETVGTMLAQVFSPLLKGIKALMDAFNSLSPTMQGVVAGITLAVPVIATLATAITALTAAVTTLKAALNPVVGIISLVTGVLAAGTVAFGAYAAASKSAAEAEAELAANSKELSTSTIKNLDKFDQLAGRLRTLRTAADQTAKSKKELKEVSDQMVRNYGALLGKIDLERASWREVEKAIYDTRAQLVSYYVAKEVKGRYDAIWDQYAKKLKDMQVLAKSLGIELDIYSNRTRPWPKVEATDKLYEQQVEELWGRQPQIWEKEYWQKSPSNKAFAKIGEYNKLVDEVNKLQARINKDLPEAQKAMELLFSFGETGLGGSPESGYDSVAKAKKGVDAELAEFERLIKSLQDASRDALGRHDAEVKRRTDLIYKYTKDETEQRKQALLMLHEWDIAESKRIMDSEIEATKKIFQDKVDYFADLNSLGVNALDQLKAATDEYYDWAKDNLPKEEQELLLLQLKQTNLRWGEYHAEKRAKEEAHQRELEDLKNEFYDRDLELQSNTYALQIRALDAYYQKRWDKLIEAGLTEEEIIAQHNEAMKALNQETAQSFLGGVSSVLGDLTAAMDQENAAQFRMWKGLAVAQAIVDTFASANAAYKSMLSIPIAGPGLAVAAAAAAIAAGWANVHKIMTTEYKPIAATGGYLIGAPHTAGGTIIEAEGGEYIIRKERVRSFGKPIFDFLNSAPLDSVRRVLAGFSLPSIPMPAYAGSFAAAGGYVSASSESSLLAEIRALKDAYLKAPRPVVNVTVDPLSNNPVKVSEIAERGDRVRSRI